jgi:hypothetical protein
VSSVNCFANITSNSCPLRRGSKKKGNKPRAYKHELINSYDVVKDSLNMGTTEIGKTFGLIDMYKDDTDPDDVYRIEKAFSKLENDTARIVTSLDAAAKKGRSSVEMPRSDLNILRKFLFLIHYRNGNHAKQFLQNNFDPLTASMIEQYRTQNGLRDSWAVWLHNVALLLEDEHWEVQSDQRLMFTAREDYRQQALQMQLGFFRAPSSVDFVLTNNGLGLYEGMKTPLHDIFSNGQGAFTLTMTYAITPKLALMLRSSLMTAEQVQQDSGISVGSNNQRLPSYFRDFPRTTADTVYNPPIRPEATAFMQMRTEEDRRLYEDWQLRGLLHGIPMHSRVKDRFTFVINDLTEIRRIELTPSC